MKIVKCLKQKEKMIGETEKERKGLKGERETRRRNRERKDGRRWS